MQRLKTQKHPKFHEWRHGPGEIPSRILSSAANAHGNLPDETKARAIASELAVLGIRSRLTAEENGYQVHIEGVVDCDKFDSEMTEQDWARYVIGRALENSSKIPVNGGKALSVRPLFPAGTRDADGALLIQTAFATLGLNLPQPNEGRLGTYYPITDAATLTQLEAIAKEYVTYTQRYME